MTDKLMDEKQEKREGKRKKMKKGLHRGGTRTRVVGWGTQWVGNCLGRSAFAARPVRLCSTSPTLASPWVDETKARDIDSDNHCGRFHRGALPCPFLRPLDVSQQKGAELRRCQDIFSRRPTSTAHLPLRDTHRPQRLLSLSGR